MKKSVMFIVSILGALPLFAIGAPLLIQFQNSDTNYKASFKTTAFTASNHATTPNFYKGATFSASFNPANGMEKNAYLMIAYKLDGAWEKICTITALSGNIPPFINEQKPTISLLKSDLVHFYCHLETGTYASYLSVSNNHPPQSAMYN